jgi:hypothetical protein
MNWHLLGTMCGKRESLMKYESDEHKNLMKEINTLSGERHAFYYWEDSKSIHKTLEAALAEKGIA